MADPLLTLDSHVDTLERALDAALDLRLDQRGRSCLDLPRMEAGGLWSACFTAFLPQGPLTEQARRAALARAEAMLAILDGLAESAAERCGRARNPEELHGLHAQGRRALVACLENTYPLGRDFKDLDRLASMGLAYATLCHQGANWVCGSNLEPQQGLTAFGRRLVHRLNELGIMVDVSHASERSAWEALEVSRAPVIASHSSCKALCDHRRNLSDDLLRAIAHSGGVVQICAYSPFLRLGAGENEASVSDFVDHLEHAIALVGVEHVGIGSDFDGGGGLSDCPDATHLPRITEELIRRGHGEAQLGLIWGKNFLRTWEETLGRASA
ncbi:dipeptidase [Holophaga foetida]|uniref:dipeptidase n=1 Tax=Holophaga foetida TaxID=35839 RepID=UPI0002473777|nr:dipeptidase [Holophaga foetida]